MTPLDPSIAIVLLAAGRAERFGGRKLDPDLGGMPVWRWAARAAEEAGFVTRLVVTDKGADLPGRDMGWRLVANRVAGEGLSASIRAGIGAAAHCARAVLMPADMPFVEAAHLRRLGLIEGVAFTALPAGERGAPAGFPAAAYPQLRNLDGDRGAAGLEWPDGVTVAPTSPASLADIDTAADIAAARQFIEARDAPQPIV